MRAAAATTSARGDPDRTAAVAGSRARVLGTEVAVLDGSVTDGSGVALVRPEHLTVVPDDAGDAEVVDVQFSGAVSRLRVRAADGAELVAQLSGSRLRGLALGTRATLGLDTDRVLVTAR